MFSVVLVGILAAAAFLKKDTAVSNSPPSTGMEAPDPETAARMMARLQEIVKESDAPISFYGQVIDQNSQPVEGAKITIHIRYYDPTMTKDHFQATKQIIVNTDRNGRFAIENARGSSLGVDTISKDGFEFTFPSNRNRGFNYDRRQGKPHLPDKNNPAIFHLRKIGTTTFLLKNPSPSPVFVRPDGNAVCVDFFRIEDDWPDESKRHPHIPGFTVSGSLSKDTRDWVLTFKGKNADDKVLLLDQIVYEAPGQVYAPSAELKFFLRKNPRVPHRGPMYPHELNACLIVRSAKPPIFTRVDLKIFPRQEEKCDIKYEITVNPYGERGFEYASEIDKYLDVRVRLHKQAVLALCRGQLAPKPDIPKLIQIAKEKAAKKK